MPLPKLKGGFIFSPVELAQVKEPPLLVPRCGACGLSTKCHTPKMEVSGNGERGVLIVGEAPGAEEDREGVQFVGKTGERLRRALKKIGVSPNRDCWFTNSLICRPKNNIVPDHAIDYCRPNLLRTVADLKPAVIVLVGSSAVKSLLATAFKEDAGGIKRWAGWVIPCRKPNAWVCHPPHTLITTTRGLVPISNVVVGDFVVSHAGNIKEVYQTLQRSYRGDLYKIKRDAAQKCLESTDSHPYYIFDGEKYTWKIAAEIKTGQYMTEPIPRSPVSPIDGKIVWKYDKPRTCGQQAKGNLSISATKSTMTLIGYYLSEGNVACRGRTTEFSFHKKEVQFHAEVQRAVTMVCGKHARTSNIFKKGSECHTTRHNGVSLAYFLAQNCGRLSHNKRFPVWLWDCSNELLSEVIRCVFNGDGCISKDRIGIALVSRQLIEDIRRALLRLGIVSSISIQKKTHGFGLPSTWKTVHRLHIGGSHAEKLANLIGVQLEYTPQRRPGRGPFFANGYVHYKIRKIDICRNWKGVVYNMEVRDDHSFIADGVSSHNCPTFHPSFIEREERIQGVLQGMFESHLASAFAKSSRPWKEVPDYSKAIVKVTDHREAAKIIRGLIASKLLVAIDLETNMLKPDSDRARIVSCAISDGNISVSYPWVGEAITATKELVKSPDVRMIGANMKFEERWFRRHLKCRGVRWKWDTVVQAHVLDNRRSIASVKFQSFVRLGQGDYDSHLKPYLQSKERRGSAENRIRDIDLNSLLLYGGLDALLEYKIAMSQAKELGVKLT